MLDFHYLTTPMHPAPQNHPPAPLPPTFVQSLGGYYNSIQQAGGLNDNGNVLLELWKLDVQGQGASVVGWVRAYLLCPHSGREGALRSRFRRR